MKYIRDYKSSFKTIFGNYKTVLWGDQVKIIDGPNSKGFHNVEIRGIKGEVHEDKLIDNLELLEFYIIDVGQGDAVLFKTPDNKWHLYDAGVANAVQMTKKGAANFLRWKFENDLNKDKIELENLILSHPDFDHFGGMVDLLNGKLFDGRTFKYKINNFYHSGMARFNSSPELGKTHKGKVVDFPEGNHGTTKPGTFIHELIDDIDSIKNARAFKTSKFNHGFCDLMSLVEKNISKAKRISHRDNYLPGYDTNNTKIQIKVLGPILEEYKNGKYGLRDLGSPGQTRNGHSIILRFDYKKARILITGDLNEKSQRLLMSYIPEEEFASDIAKGCHHGSQDIDLNFIKAMMARTTVISSGDNEDYSHPRPGILGASAFHGREIKALDLKKDTYSKEPPLLYSTELARSTKLAYMAKGKWFDKKTNKKKYINREDTEIKTGKEGYKSMEIIPLATDLIYGLINVRTDGNHILCATMEEKGSDFDVKVFKSGV